MRKGDLSCAAYYAQMKGYADEMAVVEKRLAVVEKRL
jgi:hypothetical protein